MTGLRDLPRHLSDLPCEVMGNGARSRDAEHDLFPTTLAVLGPETSVIAGCGFDFLESFQDNYLICKIRKFSEILCILNCGGLREGFRVST